MIKGLSTELNTSNNASGDLDFIIPSSTIDLRHLDPEKPIKVNPAVLKKSQTKLIGPEKITEMNLIVMKQQLMKQGMIIEETTFDNYKPLKKQTTNQIVVSAFNYGKGNLQDSISYLQTQVSGRKYYATDTYHDYNIQLALSYLEGMKMEADFRGDKYENSEQWIITELLTGVYSTDTGFDSVEKLEASGKEITPEMFESGELKFMNPKVDWKNERDELVAQALLYGDGDRQKTIKYLESSYNNTIEDESFNGEDVKYLDAINYIKGIYAYSDYSREMKKRGK